MGKSISLDDLLNNVAGHVTFQGAEYPVKAITAAGVQLAQRIETEEPPTMGELLALARKLCPTLPGEAWDEAAAMIVGVIIGVSQGPLRQVEDALPNSSGPTTNPSPAETSESRGS